MSDDLIEMTNDEAQEWLLGLLNASPPPRDAARFGAAIRAIRAKAIADAKEWLSEPYSAPDGSTWLALDGDHEGLARRAAPFSEAGREGLREAIGELLDDYLATHGPDGYPQPMPEAWRVVQDWYNAGSVGAPALDVERLEREFMAATRWVKGEIGEAQQSGAAMVWGWLQRRLAAEPRTDLEVRWDDIERNCLTCGGERWTYANDPDEREPYQVPCTNPLHIAIADERARLTPATSASAEAEGSSEEAERE